MEGEGWINSQYICAPGLSDNKKKMKWPWCVGLSFVKNVLIQGSENEEVAEDESEDKAEVKDSEDESSEEEPLRLIDSSEEEKQKDSDSLKDFIEEDEEQKEGEEEEVGKTEDKNFLSQLPRQCKISVKIHDC